MATSLAPLTNGDVARVKIPYRPRREQRAFHALGTRFRVFVCHRRLGKTVAAVNEAIKATTTCALPDAHGAYIAPFRNQAKKVAWAYVKNYTRAIPGMKFDEADLIAKFPNGALFYLAGADNLHALRGDYYDHAVIDEVSQCHPLLWAQVLRPALSDRRGSATFIGTPQGRDEFHRIWTAAAELEGWSRLMYRASETAIIHPEELAALKREMDEDSYRQEYECDFDAAIKGAYFGKQMREAAEAGRIGAVPYDAALDVHTSHDLGRRDYMVTLYWQTSPSGQVRCIDCDAFVGGDLPLMVKKLREKPYLYSGEHALPHDVRVTELGGGGSRFEQLWDMGLRGQIVQKVGHMDGVQATRRMLSRVWWDATRGDCPHLLEAMRQYRAEYDERGRHLAETAAKHWSSDFADAVRYFALHPASGSNYRPRGEQTELVLRLNADLDRAAV